MSSSTICRPGTPEAVRGTPLVQADVGDTQAIRETIRRHRVSAVMHFAAFLDVGESVRMPSRYYANNVRQTLALLDAAVDESVQHVVFSSTCAVYGEPVRTPIDEDHPTHPVNAYGETKLTIERALPHYERAYGLRSIRLRYFNAAGADPDAEIGEDHDPEIHLIPRAIAATNGGPPLQVFGNDYPTSDGTCERDYVHVADLAEAHLLALRALEAGKPSAVYNLGNGRPSSVHAVIRAVEQLTSCRVPHEVTGRRPGDPAVLFAASQRARTQLGWQPRYEALDEIVGTALCWHRDYPCGYE